MSDRLIDLGHAARRIAARPGYFLLATGVLSVGLAATLFVLSMLNSLVFARSPIIDADRVYQIGDADPNDPADVDRIRLRDLRAMMPALTMFDQIGLMASETVNLTTSDQAVRLTGTLSNAEALAMQRVRPILGRMLEPRDFESGATQAVLLSFEVWRDQFGQRGDVLGQPIRVNAVDREIVGVMPEDFDFPQRSALWLPLDISDERAEVQDLYIEPMAHLAAGVSREQADAAAARAHAEMLKTLPEVERDRLYRSAPISESFVSQQTVRILSIMFVMAFAVLLLACANVANLQIARVAERSRELALRAALGASRARLLSTVLAEAVVLVGVALAVALPLAQFAVSWMIRMLIEAGDGPPQWMEFGIDLRLLGLSVLIGLIAVVAGGLFPAWRAAALGDAMALREGTRGTRGSAARLGRLLIVFQVTISCVLLVGAGVMVQGLQRLAEVDLGIQVPAEKLLTARVQVSTAAYPDQASRARYFESVLTALREHPEVAAASASDALPGVDSGESYLAIAGQDFAKAPVVSRSAVASEFLATLGVPLVAGRAFNAADRLDSERVAIVDRRFVERYFAGQNLLDQRIQLDPEVVDSPWLRIVGVVGTLSLNELDDEQAPLVMVPLSQRDEQSMSLLIHTRGEPFSFVPKLSNTLRAIDADTPAFWIDTLAQALSKSVAGQRVLAYIYGAFGLAGLLLAGAGLYGVLAHWVEERTREFGVRRAIGASAGQIGRQVGRNAAWLVGAGLLFGVLLSVPWAAVMSSQVGYDSDGSTGIIALVVLAICAASLVAVLVPARRALAVPPAVALRQE